MSQSHINVRLLQTPHLQDLQCRANTREQPITTSEIVKYRPRQDLFFLSCDLSSEWKNKGESQVSMETKTYKTNYYQRIKQKFFKWP